MLDFSWTRNYSSCQEWVGNRAQVFFFHLAACKRLLVGLGHLWGDSTLVKECVIEDVLFSLQMMLTWSASFLVEIWQSEGRWHWTNAFQAKAESDPVSGGYSQEECGMWLPDWMSYQMALSWKVFCCEHWETSCCSRPNFKWLKEWSNEMFGMEEDKKHL